MAYQGVVVNVESLAKASRNGKTKFPGGPGGTVYTVVLYQRNKEGKWQFKKGKLSEQGLRDSLANGNLRLSNAGLDESGKPFGTTGSFERFKNPNCMVIISEIRTGDGTERVVGYKVAFPSGDVKNLRVGDVHKICTNAINHGAVAIQNAQFVAETKDKAAYIRGYLKDQFIVEHLAFTKPSNVKPAEPVKADTEKLSALDKLKKIYTEDQIKQLADGKRTGVDIRVYANPKLSAPQMAEIKKGLQRKVESGLFASPEFSVESMAAYRIEMEGGVEVRNFINPEYTADQIFELGTAVSHGVDIKTLADPKKSANDMAKERIELETKIFSDQRVSIFDILANTTFDD